MNKNYETCKNCPYYFGEIDQCMFGEEGVPNNLEKKCEKENKKGKNGGRRSDD